MENITTFYGFVDSLRNVSKINKQILIFPKELITDFRKNKTNIEPLVISGDCVEASKSSGFWVCIQRDLSWNPNTKELVKGAQQRLLPEKLLVSFYRCSI